MHREQMGRAKRNKRGWGSQKLGGMERSDVRCWYMGREGKGGSERCGCGLEVLGRRGSEWERM